MPKNRSYRVSEDFLKKLDQVKNYYQNELQINLTNEQLFDEMMNIFYATIFMKSNEAIGRLINNEVTSALEQFTVMTAKFHNAVLEEIKLQNRK